MSLGSGKTLIAALLLRWSIEKELEDRASRKKRRIAFFLVDKVALVFQQFAVLDCNLDYPAEKFCGETVVSMWNQQAWSDIFSKNEIIVCTAEILYQCLHHSYISMDQINLLIFDEAHHTKKNHPYAKIIKDFYIETERNTRYPRIFGMTASPVDAQVDVGQAAAELEGLLHSQIVTAANPEHLQWQMCRPNEVVVDYSRLMLPFKTHLYQTVEKLLGQNEIFRRALSYSRFASAELGSWCADRFWKLYFGINDLPKFEAKTEQSYLKMGSYDSDIEQSIGRVREAFRVVQIHSLGTLTLAECHLGMLSSKVSKLVHILEDKFADPKTTKRCLVFVQRRWTAMMLTDLFQQRGMTIPGLRVDALVGAGSGGDNTDYDAGSFRDQVMKLLKFKKGELNCLFTTSVAEEGLDIQDCNMIIRFDLYSTMIQYIQSRGRARQKNSDYIHMVEAGNAEQARRVRAIKSNEEILRRFCAALPENRKLTGNDFDVDFFLRKEKSHRQYTVPASGAKLTYKSALTCLANFTASLPHPSEVVYIPGYSVLSVQGGFQCEVTMPETSPVQSAQGRVQATKQVAKCSAAFEMCLMLIEGKYLDEYLRPIFTKQLPAMRNAHLSISSKKRAEYMMRTKPEMWSQLGIPNQLYVTVLTLAEPEALGCQSRPLLLLTRQPIPAIAKFPLFFAKDRSSGVCCTPVPTPVPVKDDDLATLTNFTLRIFLDVFSKDYDTTSEHLPYFFAPLKHGSGFSNPATTNAQGLIDWGMLEDVRKTGNSKSTGDEPEGYFQDKFLTDPWDGSRKLFIVRRSSDLKPTDRVPEGVNVSGQHRAWNKLEPDQKNIINFSVSLWSNTRNRFVWKQDQPVYEAQVLWIRRNLLDDNLGDEDVQFRKCFVILEPFNISPLPASIVSMAMNLPSILFKLESTLIALDACNALGLAAIEPSLALESFTKDSDNTEEHDVEQINFQGGMGNNYERLEFLGDTFLKMATTISIFTLLPDEDEFAYHVERMLLICNKNLFNNALENKIQEYIRSKSLNRRTWYPEGLTLRKGKKTDPASMHTLGDKSIADVCEALIGAAYLTAQKSNSVDLAVRAVTIMVNDPKHKVHSWPEYYSQYSPPEWQVSHPSPVQEDMARRISARLGYTFNHPRLLRCAFMHPSYPSRSYEKLPSYQRLEFLGDALLDMCSVAYLFHRFPGADPQWLTEHKMAMVSNKFLGCLSVALGFHKNVVSFSSALQSEIVSYVTDVTLALEKAQSDVVAAGLPKDEYPRNYWVDCLTPPKCLSDVVESYIGAIFVDSQYDFSVVQKFFDTHVLPYFTDMSAYDAFASNHPVTRISKLLSEKFQCSDWRLLVQEIGAATAVNEGDGKDNGTMSNGEAYDLVVGTRKVVAAVRVHGQTLAHGMASSGRQAKTIAAKKGLEELEGMEVEVFRSKFACDCGAGDAVAEGSTPV